MSGPDELGLGKPWVLPRLTVPSLSRVLPPRSASSTTPGARHLPGLACGTRGKFRPEGPFQGSKTNHLKAPGPGVFSWHL